MHATQEVQQHFIEMSVTQYAKLHGLSPETVRRRCEQGLLDAFKLSDDLKSSHWRIKVSKNDTVTREQYEAVLRENAELRATIDGIVRQAQGMLARKTS